MGEPQEVSSLTLNRLSVYLRCLRQLQIEGTARVSSSALAERFQLSAPLIRKDLANFGEFGIRGVGYEVDGLIDRIHGLLGLDVTRRLLVVGMGRLGSALAGYLDFNQETFRVVAGIDNDPAKIGKRIGRLTVRPSADLEAVLEETGADIAILAVPPEVAQANYDALVAAGVRAVLNFAPVQIREDSRSRLKNVDFRINLEELVFFVK